MDLWWSLGTGSKQKPRTRAEDEEVEELTKQQMDDLIERNGGMCVG